MQSHGNSSFTNQQNNNAKFVNTFGGQNANNTTTNNINPLHTSHNTMMFQDGIMSISNAAAVQQSNVVSEQSGMVRLVKSLITDVQEKNKRFMQRVLEQNNAFVERIIETHDLFVRQLLHQQSTLGSTIREMKTAHHNDIQQHQLSIDMELNQLMNAIPELTSFPINTSQTNTNPIPPTNVMVQLANEHRTTQTRTISSPNPPTNVMVQLANEVVTTQARTNPNTIPPTSVMAQPTNEPAVTHHHPESIVSNIRAQAASTLLDISGTAKQTSLNSPTDGAEIEVNRKRPKSTKKAIEKSNRMDAAPRYAYRYNYKKKNESEKQKYVYACLGELYCPTQNCGNRSSPYIKREDEKSWFENIGNFNAKLNMLQTSNPNATNCDILLKIGKEDRNHYIKKRVICGPCANKDIIAILLHKPCKARMHAASKLKLANSKDCTIVGEHNHESLPTRTTKDRLNEISMLREQMEARKKKAILQKNAKQTVQMKKKETTHITAASQSLDHTQVDGTSSEFETLPDSEKEHLAVEGLLQTGMVQGKKRSISSNSVTEHLKKHKQDV